MNNYTGDTMFYLLNICLGLIFIYLDIFNYDSNIVKYFTIINNFIYLIINQVNKKAILASLFTVIADYFLLFTNYYVFGISCFIIVQYCYMELLDYKTTNFFYILILFPLNPLIITTTIYVILSISNLITSFKLINHSKHHKYLFLTILFLLICDIFVSLTNINIQTFACFNKIIWIFYLPSQLFFVYSQIVLEK